MNVELKRPKEYINGKPYYAITAITGILEQILGEKISTSDARRIMVEYAKIKTISCANERFYGTLYSKEDADWWFVTPSTQVKLKEFYRQIKEMREAAIKAATQKTKKPVSTFSSKTPEEIRKENERKMAELIKAQEEKERRSKEEDMDYVSDELLRNDGVYYTR